MKFDTQCVRAAIKPDPTTGAIVPPIYQSATFVLPGIGEDLGFDYTRSSNPPVRCSSNRWQHSRASSTAPPSPAA